MDEPQLVTSQLVMQLSMACPIFRSNVPEIQSTRIQSLVFSVTLKKHSAENWRLFAKVAKRRRERKETEGGKADFLGNGGRITCARRSGIKGGPNVFSRPVFIVCVPTWPVKTAFNSSQFTRLLRKEERNPEDVRRPAPGIERNSEWLFAVP